MHLLDNPRLGVCPVRKGVTVRVSFRDPGTTRDIHSRSDLVIRVVGEPNGASKSVELTISGVILHIPGRLREFYCVLRWNYGKVN